MNLSYVEINNADRTLRGMKHNSNHNRYVFLIVHGYFSSNKIGPHRLYVTMADALCERYGSVYRFDLSGMGESDGAIEDTHLSTQVEDVVAILHHIQENNNAVPIIVISHCMGCNLVLEILKKKEFALRETIFIAPYFTNEAILRLFFKEQGQLEDLYVKGYTYRNGLYTDRSFFLESSFYDNFLDSINNSDVYINIIAAGSDQFIPRRCNEALRNNGKKISFLYIENADHNFLTTRSELYSELFKIIEDGNHT